MFRLLLIVKSVLGVLFSAGLYGMAWDLATRGRGYLESEVWFFSGLAVLLGFGCLVASTALFVNLESIKEKYGGY